MEATNFLGMSTTSEQSMRRNGGSMAQQFERFQVFDDSTVVWAARCEEFVSNYIRTQAHEPGSGNVDYRIRQNLDLPRLIRVFDAFFLVSDSPALNRPPLEDLQFVLQRVDWPEQVNDELQGNLLSHAEKGYEAERNKGDEDLAEFHYSSLVSVLKDGQLRARNVVADSCRAWCLVWALSPMLNGPKMGSQTDLPGITRALQLWEDLFRQWPLDAGDTRSALDLHRRLGMLALADAQAAVSAAGKDQKGLWELTWRLAGPVDEIDEEQPPRWIVSLRHQGWTYKDCIKAYLCVVLGIRHGVLLSNHKDAQRWTEQAMHWLPQDGLQRVRLNLIRRQLDYLKQLPGSKGRRRELVKQLQQQMDSIQAYAMVLEPIWRQIQNLAQRPPKTAAESLVQFRQLMEQVSVCTRRITGNADGVLGRLKKITREVKKILRDSSVLAVSSDQLVMLATEASEHVDSLLTTLCNDIDDFGLAKFKVELAWRSDLEPGLDSKKLIQDARLLLEMIAVGRLSSLTMHQYFEYNFISGQAFLGPPDHEDMWEPMKAASCFHKCLAFAHKLQRTIDIELVEEESDGPLIRQELSAIVQEWYGKAHNFSVIADAIIRIENGQHVDLQDLFAQVQLGRPNWEFMPPHCITWPEVENFSKFLVALPNFDLYPDVSPDEVLQYWSQMYQQLRETVEVNCNLLHFRRGMHHDNHDFRSRDVEIFSQTRTGCDMLVSLYNAKYLVSAAGLLDFEDIGRSIRQISDGLSETAAQMVVWSERAKSQALVYQLPLRAGDYSALQELRSFQLDDELAWKTLLASQSACGPGTAFVVYHHSQLKAPLDEDRVFLVGPDGCVAQSAVLGRHDPEQLEALVCQAFPGYMSSATKDNYADWRDMFSEQLADLFDRYVRPIYPALERLCPSSHQKVVFCASGGLLTHIPFALLRNREKGTYLFERHTVSFTPSLRVLYHCHQRLLSLQQLPLMPGAGAGVALGDAAYLDQSKRLRGAGEEVNTICSIFDSRDGDELVVKLQGTKASREGLLEWARKPSTLGCCQGFIHFAVHGRVDKDRFERGALELADPRVDEKRWPPDPVELSEQVRLLDLGKRKEEMDDLPCLPEIKEAGPYSSEHQDSGGRMGGARIGVLPSEAIAGSGFDWRAHLVVLSACNTVWGKEGNEEGILNLPRAFMVAGVPCSVVSHWLVQDDITATPHLMKLFYTALRKGKDVATALRSAMVEMLAQGHPIYDLAPFMVWGLPSVCLPPQMQEQNDFGCMESTTTSSPYRISEEGETKSEIGNLDMPMLATSILQVGRGIGQGETPNLQNCKTTQEKWYIRVARSMKRRWLKHGRTSPQLANASSRIGRTPTPATRHFRIALLEVQRRPRPKGI